MQTMDRRVGLRDSRQKRGAHFADELWTEPPCFPTNTEVPDEVLTHLTKGERHR